MKTYDDREVWELLKLERLHRGLNKPTRRKSKAGRRMYRQMTCEQQPDNMLNMPRPAHHRPVPLINDERTKAELARHVKRREAGWIRG